MTNQHMIKVPAILIFNKRQIEIARAHHFPYEINKDFKIMVQEKLQ